MRAETAVVGISMLSAMAVAQQEVVVERVGLLAQISQGFGQIITGSIGLKLTVVFLILIGFAVGYYLATSGKI